MMVIRLRVLANAETPEDVAKVRYYAILYTL